MADGIEILILGESSAAEMRGVMDAVLRCFPRSDVRMMPDCLRIDDEQWNPSLVVVCQSWPDEFSKADVLRLFARFPLGRWVCCFGLWCESDGRTRDAWPVGVRVPARNALGRLIRERDVLSNRAAALPLTAGREEAFEFDSWRPARWSSSFSLSVVRPRGVERTPASLKAELQRVAAVHSPDGELRRCFEDRLRGIGYAIETVRDDSSPDVLLFDADPWSRNAVAEIRRLRSRHPEAAVVALMNFAPPEDVRAVARCGADAVIPKLIDDAALAAALSEVSAVHAPVEQVPEADGQRHEERHQEMDHRGERQHD